MPVSADTLRLLMESGLEGEMLLRVVGSIDADNPVKKRSAGAERQAKYRERQKAASAVTSDVTRDVTESVTEASPPRVRVEGSSSSKDISEKKTKSTPRHELETILDAERATAVIDHRQRLRKPLTAHAASLLAKKFSKCPDPNAAADLMIEKGWQGIEASWLENQRNSTGPPNVVRLRTVEEIFASVEAENEQRNQAVRGS